ncbi:hypothetical protein J6590_050276 [Homalodisca vitripennis]|nr:hypothetical protein J6590_050276 [Homalodisca vitripennis]
MVKSFQSDRTFCVVGEETCLLLRSRGTAIMRIMSNISAVPSWKKGETFAVSGFSSQSGQRRCSHLV